MPKRKQGEVDNQGVQDFELIELLIREAYSDKGTSSTSQGSDFESFKARFQSYIDQIPSYLHSVGKEGFFPHFFLGSFSTLIDTEIAKKLDIEKIYFSFDGSKTLKVAVIKKEKITSPEDAANKVKLFVIGESDSTSKKFSYGELDKILGNANIVQNNHVRQAIDKGKLGVKLVEITKKKDAKGKTAGISVEVKSDNLDQDTSTAHEFKEIKKGLWSSPEGDIAKLTNSNAGKVKESVEEILKRVSKIHSEYRGEFKEERLIIRDGSLVYAKEAREAAHHGFVAGALVNFRYRHNLRVYLEQFAGRGYADIVLVPRGKDRSLNAIPIIIEMKAATKAELEEGKIGEKSGTTPASALKQAEDYTKGFQPNVMRVLTTANDILCVGVNLDHPSPISDIMDKSRNQKITPLFNEILGSIDERNNGKIDEGELKKRIQNNIERIYHTFPGTGEKGDNHYFSRFLLGQSLLLNEVKVLNSNFEKHVFIYGENIPTEAHSKGKERDVPQREAAKKGGEKLAESTKLDQSHGVTTMVFIPENDKKSVYVMNIVETDGRTEVLKKGIPLDQLKQKVGNRKIVELDLNFNINEKSNFQKYFSMEVKEPVSLEQYNNKKTDKFKGSFENVPYPNELKKTFDEVLKSQHIDQSASEAPDPEKLKETLNKALDKYKELLGKVGEGMFPFKSSIEKEAHFQAVLHGLFSHYSDIKLGELPDRALILTEFQTGKGKRIDMVVHGIKFASQDGNAKEYIPVGLELKGPREGKTTDKLIEEANKQIIDEYTKGVTYKTLTDGDKAAFIGVVFDKKAKDKSSLILTSKEFQEVEVRHSSIFSSSKQQLRKKFKPNSCVGQGSRGKRSINLCLFSRDDVEKFSKGKVDANNVDKTIIDSEKFLTYVKNSQDEAKNAQLVEFIGDKSIEGDRKYLLDKVVGDQGYERYVQNERIKDLHGDIVHQDSSLTKNPKLKGRLMNAAGGIQLIRGIHGAIVSCQDGVTTDCGLNLGGMGWSFASQPIENAVVKITPKVLASAEKVVGKIPGVLGKQTKFAVQVAGVKFGSKIAGGVAGAITGVFDIVDIGISASNLVDCKKRENSDNPCGEKEIRDNIASIAFSSVSFISGVALVANTVIGIAVGFALMVGQGVYSGISNVIEYKKKYGTTADESNRIFWHTFVLQPIPQDVQHLAARKEMVNSLTKGAWKTLNDTPDNVVAYAFGLGRVSGNTLSSSHAKIFMNKKDTAYTKNLSRVIPDNIEGASMICLPQITNQDYEKGITSSVSSAVYYCENAVVISRSNTNQANPTIIYDLQNVVDGRIIGSNEWNNNFLINKGNIEITGSNNVVIGGDNVVNKFVFLDTPSSSGKVIGGRNSTNILDLSEAKKDRNINVAIQDSIVPDSSGKLKVRINGRVLVNSGDPSNYYYVGRKSKVDEILCMGHSTHFTRHEVIVDSGGSSNNNEKDVVENCKKVIISPYTTVKGGKSNYTFYVKTGGYKGKDLRSEIVGGTGTIVFSEFDLLSDCDQITYSTNSNTLSLKINFDQNNQFTLDIKNYVEQSSNKPLFALIDKNGSNIVPKIEKSDSSTIKINSFELHSEYSLDNFDDVENHCKKILNSNKDYKVFSVIRGKTQSQDNNIVPHMVFGSSGDDVINFDQGTMFARGGKGSDMYVIADDINNKEVKIDNHSDDEKADTLFMPEVEKDFLVQQCNLHLNYNNTSIQVKNYLQDRNYRHLVIMNKKGEAFIPDIQSMSCSSSGKGKLVPFLQATQTQNMFLLPKDFQDNHVVIDSHLEDIKKYKDKDDLLLMRESEIPFIIRIEEFYIDRSKWESISYSLWNNNDLLPSPELLENVDNVMEYKDKLRNDYERIVKEYIMDFSNPTTVIQHNQKSEKGISTFIGEDEERIGVMILKNTSPDQVEVLSSGEDLIFRDKKSNHTIKIKDWDNNESYRISKLEFDLGLEPIKILRLNRFSLSEVREIQNLIDKASENHQNREEYNSRVEDDFRCLISLHSLMKKPTYQCSGFFSLQDQTDFVKSACSREQVEEFENNIPSVSQLIMLLEKLHNDLSLNGYNQNTIDKCSQVITSGFGVLNLWINKAVDEDKWDEVQTLLDRTANRSNADVEHKNKCSKSWTLLNYFVYNGNVDLGKDIFKLILKKSGSIDALEDGNGWAALHYAVYYGNFNMTSFLVDEGAKVDVKNKEGKTPLYLVIEEAKRNKLDMIKLLVERGADIEAKDNDGKSPLYLITYSGDLDTIKLLFEMIKAKDNSSLKTIKEIDSLRRKIINQQNIPFNVKSFVDFYVSDAVQTVAKELRDNVSMHGCTAIAEFGDEIYEFNKGLFKEIMTKFISVVYGKTLDSDGILECIDSYHHAEEKIHSYIALLDEMKRNDHLSDNAVFKLAYNVKKIIDSGERYDLKEIKNRLPGCVKNVVFPSKVCIRNVKYDEYLYPTNTKVTDDRRVIATYSINKATWKIEFKDGKFYIISNEGEHLYAADYAQYDDERRSVFTWIGGNQVKNDEWNIVPKGDICDLVNVGQREYLYSPVDYFKGKYSRGKMFPGLRPVFTWIGGSRVTNSEWKFEDCSRSRRKRNVEEFESEVSLGSHLFQVAKARENSNDTQILELSARLQDNLLPNSHSEEGIVHWYSRSGNEDMLNKMMSSVLASVKEVIYPDQSNSRLDLDSCSKNNASSCPPLMRNIYNTINLDTKNIFTGKENVLEITSGYERLDIENFPIQEKVINVNRKRSLLDLSKLVKQVDRDLGIKPIPMIAKNKNDLLIKLSISATSLKKDVMTVRLKDVLINNSYKKLQVIFDNVPMEIDNNLKLTPSILISDSKIIVVIPQNIEEGNKLIICREVEGYTFLHHKYDLIMTNALSANVSEKELYVMYFKDFYKEPKMKTLSIRFIDKEILLDDKINKIYNSDNIDKLNHANFTLNLQDRGTNIKANDFHDDKVLKLAYCIKEVIEKTNNKEEISSFERLKNKLPESVKNIVFSPTACIKNVRSDGYLYASSDRFRYNHERRVVSTQVGGRKNQQVFWKVDPSPGNSYIKNVKFNECLHPPVNKNVHSSEGRNVFTLIGGGEDQCNFWKFEPIGENVRIQDVKSGKYLYVPIHNSKHNNNGSNVSTERTKDEKSLWRFEDCGFTRNKRDIQQLESKVREKSSGAQQTLALSEKSQGDVYLLRKPLAIDSSNRPEITASSGTRPSSWINIIANTIVDAIKDISRFIYSPLKVELPGVPEKGSGYYNTARNPNKQYTSQFSSEVCMSNNIGLTFFLLQSFLDKKYPLPKMCSITPEEVLASTLNIIGEFEEILRKTAKQSGVLVKGVNFFKIYLDIADHVRNERYCQIPNILYSAAKEAYSQNEKFLSILKVNVEKMLNEEQILSNGYNSSQALSMVNVSDKMPLSSLNSIAIEPVKSRKEITYGGQVV